MVGPSRRVFERLFIPGRNVNDADLANAQPTGPFVGGPTTPGPPDRGVDRGPRLRGRRAGLRHSLAE